VKEDELKGALGFANPKTKEAYIKRTGVKEWDDETILHEAEELLAKASLHEEDGIRWKKAKEVVRKVLPVVAPIVAAPLGPLAAGLAGAAASAASQRMAGGRIRALPTILGGVGGYIGGAAMQPGIQASRAMEGGYIGQVLSGVQQALTGTSGAQRAIGETIKKAQFLPGRAATAAELAAGAPTITTPLPGTIGTGLNILGGIGTPTPTPPGTPGGGVGVGAGTQIAKEAPRTIGQTVGEILKKPSTILGATTVLGSMAIPTPKFPEVPEIGLLREKLMAGEALSPLGQQARASLQEILQAKPEELYPTASDAYYQAAIRRTEEAYNEALKRLDAAYNLAGVYGSGEHLAARDKLQEELARTKAGIAAEMEQRRFELARTAQYQAIQDALGVDRDVMDDIVGLTQLSAELVAQMYGADVADIVAIRKALGTLGTELIIRGLPQPTPTATQGAVTSILGQQ
jgi:hypothetical protein